MVGSVTRSRYEGLVAASLELVELSTRCQFDLGDIALEIEPMRARGGSSPDGGGELFTVKQSLTMFAEDVGLAYSTVCGHRWVAGQWPVEHRSKDASHEVHRILASGPNPFERIKHPPVNPRSGKARWCADTAKRSVGWKADTPVNVQEKVEAIHDLAADEVVAAQVATDLLRRPDVAFKAMRDNTARHLVNQAQFEQTREAEDFVREQVPLVGQLQRTAEFMDLVGACHLFVAGAGRLVPAMRGHHFSEQERGVVEKNLQKVRAMCDWIETAVATGNVDADDALAQLLRGE
ncbi:hypothetical protein DMA15_00100 [Streptomyces sp. WAC 01529]|uniref:DUF6192 family protein n=1 Tax=Streptomyces sp. WAC 01529 TaxID=2203205 RepID=UPI000F6F3263|nr:DUF6192 family protein [Streptomyces sp. WAC 01529]AZM57371.1 hypothetical protein DMA15_00100 [Streptomyces sp. WAC 01529]